MIKFINAEQIICVIENKQYDFDRYNFETHSQIGTKETSVIVDFRKYKIYGDRVAYGSWYDIDVNECIEFLQSLKPHEIKRDFSTLISQYTI